MVYEALEDSGLFRCPLSGAGLPRMNPESTAAGSLAEQPVVRGTRARPSPRTDKFLLFLKLCVSGQPSAMPLNEAVVMSRRPENEVTQVVVHGVDLGEERMRECGRPKPTLSRSVNACGESRPLPCRRGRDRSTTPQGMPLLSLEPFRRWR